MAGPNRFWSKVGPKTLDRGNDLVTLWGSFLLPGAGAIVTQDCLGFSFSRTGVGQFTITLDNSYGALYAIKFNTVQAVPVETTFPVKTAAVTANPATITFETWVATAAADLTAGGTLMVEITLRATNTTLFPRKGA